MHMMGTNFVGKVRDVRQMAEEQIGEGVVDMVEFMARVNGHKATEKANKIQVWYNDITHSDEGLGMGHQEDREGANTHLGGANQELVYCCDASLFYGTLSRALNRKVSPYNRSLYKSMNVEVQTLLVSRDTFSHSHPRWMRG